MFSIYTIIITFLIYMGILFFIAYSVDNKNFLNSKKLAPYIYALSFSIYCTAWTYYGSVGLAVNSGFLFLSVYLGPTLIILLWPIILKKMIRIKNIFKITSLADLITVRYDKSRLIGAIVSIGALLGTIPYISIQLKALITSIEILQDKSIEVSNYSNMLSQNVGLIIVVLMIFFTIIFGLRKLDPTERHKGMMVIVAIESLVKLFAIIIIGVFVVFFVMNGIDDVLTQAQNKNLFTELASENGGKGYSTWVSIMILSMFAIMFLPRQFHVSVVENSSEKHISTVMWILPLYLLLITFFTIPIAMSGSLLDPNTAAIDFYVLTIPIGQKETFLSMIAFIGGFSASTSMIMITSMTMSIMISNYLLLPLIELYKPLAFLKKRILILRWAIVSIFIAFGYIFYLFVSKDNLIVNIGLISFTAILQFAPVIIGGLFWKEADKQGALYGLLAGFGIWFFTLIIPQFVHSGLLSNDILVNGVFGIWFLKPTALFGFSEFSSIPHAVFWSMLFNISAFIIFSMTTKKTEEATQTANNFVNALESKKKFQFNAKLKNNVNLKNKVLLFEEVMNNYFSKIKTDETLNSIISHLGHENKLNINILDFSKLYYEIEKVLTGSIGSAGAHNVLVTNKLFSKQESIELSNVYADMLSKMKITPEEFNTKINYFEERENLQKRHSDELVQKISERDIEIEARKDAESEIRLLNENLETIVGERTNELKVSNNELTNSLEKLKETQDHLIESEKIAGLGNLVAGVAHEINTPVGLSLTGITHFLDLSEQIHDLYENENLSEDEFHKFIDDSRRLAKSININLVKTAALVRSFKQVAVDQSSEVKRSFDLYTCVEDTLMSIHNITKKSKVHIKIDCASGIEVKSYPGAISQIITNLVLNSLLHAYDDDSTGNIVIKFYKGEEVNEYILKYTDDGKGIAKENQKKIFEPFFTTNREKGGSGLGMSIIHNLITTKLDGDITCESEVGVGSKFFIIMHL
ncbi:MAG: hypothetical protein HRT43_10865 [Campylobacteraceae bacterium]|nr:hypothetical protein [Campylobacteraceae bacterium]